LHPTVCLVCRTQDCVAISQSICISMPPTSTAFMKDLVDGDSIKSRYTEFWADVIKLRSGRAGSFDNSSAIPATPVSSSWLTSSHADDGDAGKFSDTNQETSAAWKTLLQRWNLTADAQAGVGLAPLAGTPTSWPCLREGTFPVPLNNSAHPWGPYCLPGFHCTLF
jgi:hypothetical protein